MKTFFNVWKTCIITAFKSAIIYRTNFILSVIILLAGNILFPLLTVLIYSNGANFPGWTIYEALLIQAVFLVNLGIANSLFFRMVWLINMSVVNGNFEIVLLRPVNCILLSVAQAFNLEGIFLALGGVALMVFSLSHMAFPSLLMWLVFFIYMLGGILVLFGLILLMSASMFKLVGNSRIFEIFDSVTEFGRFPATLFPKAVFNIVCFVIPVAMIGFFPASVLMGDIQLYQIGALFICIAFAAVGVLVFNRCIRSYQSAGG